MKRLVPCILLALIVLIFAAGAEALLPSQHSRVYHHTEAADAAWCETVAEGEFCTHLPLVEIQTQGQEMSHETEILASLSITDNDGGHNHLSQSPTLKTDMLIKLRGNSSSRFDKKQYRLTFVDTTGFDAATGDLQSLPHVSHKVMGMSSESEWVLNGPFLDKTLVRNYLMYNLSGEIMEWAPNVRYCEVILDGEYMGIYLMLETVKVDENRVDLTRLNENNVITSYMLNRERVGDTAYPLDNFGTYAGKTYNELGVVYPGVRSGRTEEHMEFVRQDIGAFERMLYSLDYDHQTRGYKSAIDVQSFVDYFILNEFAMNVDSGGLSTYIHKDVRSGFVMGPVWDFNNGFDNYEYYSMPYDEFYLISKPWYVMLLRDEQFVEQIINRYAQLRAGVMSEEKIFTTIDEAVAFLGPALQRNEDKWGYSYADGWLDNVDTDFQPLDYDRNPTDHAHAVAQLKETIQNRGRFLDEYIHVLRQFCAESKVKEWN